MRSDDYKYEGVPGHEVGVRRHSWNEGLVIVETNYDSSNGQPLGRGEVLAEDAGTVAAELLKAAGVALVAPNNVGTTHGPLSVYHQDTLGNRSVYRPDHARQVALSLLLAADEAERPTYDEGDVTAVREAVIRKTALELNQQDVAAVLEALESRGWKKEAA